MRKCCPLARRLPASEKEDSGGPWEPAEAWPPKGQLRGRENSLPNPTTYQALRRAFCIKKFIPFIHSIQLFEEEKRDGEGRWARRAWGEKTDKRTLKTRQGEATRRHRE